LTVSGGRVLAICLATTAVHVGFVVDAVSLK